MRKISIIILAIILCAIPVFADMPDDMSVTDGCHTLDGQIPVLGSAQLVSNTGAAVLYETNTDTLMYAHNADGRIEPASLLKIMTALIAIEKGDLDDVVTVRAEVLDSIPADAAVVELVADEVVTVKDLLYCMMVGSGNDAAVVLADYVMGSQTAFVAEMNRFAIEIGCAGTNFTNVHGLSHKDQYTTARDVARILTVALENEEFCQVFEAKYYDMPSTNKSEARHLATQNFLINNDKIVIYYDERVTGGRTAVNSDRTRSIAVTAQANDMELICVVIGSKSQFEKDGYTEKVFGGYDETKQLLDMAFNGYKTAQVLFADQILQQSSVLNGSCDVSVGIRDGARSVIPVNMDANALTFRYADEAALTAPIEKGQKLSNLQIWNGSVCIAQTETFAMNSVSVAGVGYADGSDQSEDMHVAVIILCVIGGIAVVIFVAFASLLAVRRIRIAKAKRHSRRYSRSRRRSK